MKSILWGGVLGASMLFSSCGAWCDIGCVGNVTAVLPAFDVQKPLAVHVCVGETCVDDVLDPSESGIRSGGREALFFSIGEGDRRFSMRVDNGTHEFVLKVSQDGTARVDDTRSITVNVNKSAIVCGCEGTSPETIVY